MYDRISRCLLSVTFGKTLEHWHPFLVSPQSMSCTHFNLRHGLGFHATRRFICYNAGLCGAVPAGVNPTTYGSDCTTALAGTLLGSDCPTSSPTGTNPHTQGGVMSIVYAWCRDTSQHIHRSPDICHSSVLSLSFDVNWQRKEVVRTRKRRTARPAKASAAWIRSSTNNVNKISNYEQIQNLFEPRFHMCCISHNRALIILENLRQALQEILAYKCAISL